MSLSLPTKPELRSMFQVEDLVNYMSLPTFCQTLHACRETVKQDGIRTVQGLCMKADGEIWLIQVGKKGAWKKLWNFGNPVNKV
jgi:hypothetical protein